MTQVPKKTTDAMPAFLVDFVTSGVVAPEAMAKTALRYAYDGWEEPLAHVASDGRRTFDEVVAAAADPAAAPDVVADLRSTGLYALAYLVLGRPGDTSRYDRGADLFALARRVVERDGTRLEHAQLDIQSHLAAGRHDYVRRHAPTSGLDPWILWASEIDLINPFGGRAPGDLEPWHTAFNAPFIERGIAPMRFADVESPFDSVTTEAPAGSVDGPLVSIVMPVFKPSLSLLTAVRSLLEQTWRNIEVILVDDATPEGYESVFEAATALDERVHYLRMPTNGGAYRARNRGVAHARGEIVGIQDGDDWSHPDRIEQQMRLFDQDPALVATLSMAVRLHADLRIIKVGSQPFAKNAPSLLFKRELVLDRLGTFDEMRQAADTEFIERLGAAFGPGSVQVLKQPLALYQLTDGSLSRADFRLSWHREARVSYHGSFRHWHGQIADKGASPVVKSVEGRAFPAPPELLGTPYPTPPPDVVILADWREAPLAYAGLPAQVDALASAGLSVGIARGDAMRFATNKRFYARDEIQQLLADGTATLTPLGAPIEPPVLIVRDTDLVSQPRERSAVAMRPGRVIVMADRLPSTGERPRLSYDPVQVELSVREMFHTQTEWWPSTAEIGGALLAAGAAGPIHDPRPTDVVTVSRFTSRHLAVSPPVIGVADSSPFVAERADRTTLTSLLPRGAAHDVRVLESSAQGPSLPNGWLAFHPGLVTPSEFFDQCDFVVGLAPKVSGTSLVRPVIEAMARGAVVIAAESYRSELGDAALYIGDATVQQHVDACTADPDRYAAQQLRSLAFCQTDLSAEAFATAVSTLIRIGVSG